MAIRERIGGAAGRTWRAAKLDDYIYEDVADKPELTTEAVTVALLSSFIMNLGLMLVGAITPFWWIVGSIAWGLGILFVGTWVVATFGRLLRGQATYHQLLRALGYAMAPQALGFIPIADFVPGFLAGGIWATVCAIRAVRDVHKLPIQVAITLVVAPLLMALGATPLLVALTQGAS